MRPRKMISRQRVVDWTGFVCAIAFGVVLWRRNTELGILMLPTLLYQVITAASFLLRRAPRAKTGTLAARISAYGVTVLVPAYFAFAPVWHAWNPPLAVRWVGLVLWLGSGVFGLWTAWELRYSFSIEPQARQLVAKGPYRWLRHPMYAGYLAQYVSVMLRDPTLGFALVFVAWCLLLAVRIGFEERVLTSVFPQYASYRREVGALFPRLRTPRAAASSAPAQLSPMEVR